jgi:GWxTD domain-containing protein
LFFSKKDCIFFQIDTAHQQGVSILNKGEFYPKIVHSDQMLEPLQYVTNTFEYQNLSKQKNQKLAIDNFWLGKTDNIERSRELIRVYYNRIYFANYFFTSDREGWKTDRGMVYTIYGPPEAIFKTAQEEEWLYFRDSKSDPIKFVFRYQQNRFTMNDFRLSRPESNTAAWKDAQLRWQTGSIFYVSSN